MSHRIRYILDNTNELMLQDRVHILQLIFNSPFRNKLKEKGNGTQIRLSDLSDELLEKIHEFIFKKINDGENDISF